MHYLGVCTRYTSSGTLLLNPEDSSALPGNSFVMPLQGAPWVLETFIERQAIRIVWSTSNERGSRGGVYPIELSIETENRTGMLARLTEVIAKESSNIRQFEAGTATGMGLIDVVVEVRNRRHLDRLRQAIGALPGVLRVSRRRSGSRPSKKDRR